MEQQIVKPVSTKSEVIYLFVAVAVVVMIAGGVIAGRIRPSDEKVLKAHQISAFRDLATLEQGTFNDLYAAAMEINELHGMGDEEWPSLATLENEFMPPFVKDQVWEKRGSLAWEQRVPWSGTRHVALYLGVPRDAGGFGCFLLVMLHDHAGKRPGTDTVEHAPYEIWHHDEPDVAFPEIVTDQALMAKGWKEVVPYKGEEEVKRLKGE
ncbi:MAG: hypothetical protein GY737_04185 [Desulfobacteraceae bacterium]|nr:hypothetical protein [Desulfobacteraceae bacterium]